MSANRLAAVFLVAVAASADARQIPNGQVAPPPPLVLAGGTVVDLTSWGDSANDIPDAIIYIRDGHVLAVGPRSALPIPKGSQVIDCTGKYLIPGLIDGFAGMSSQADADANLYMGVTTVVAGWDERRGPIDQHANPTPHVYLLDSVGSTDDYSLLIHNPTWAQKLKDPPDGRSVELSPDDTARQLLDTAKLGTRVVWLGHNLTAANTQWIVDRAHQIGLITYGEFVSTPYRVAIQAGVDALLHMGRYELGVIPDELQQPLTSDPEGSASRTAYGYAERLPPMDPHWKSYGQLIAQHHVALMPTFSNFYTRLPNHRNLWKEPVARILDPKLMFAPSDPQTGEAVYSLPAWARHAPNSVQRWMEENLHHKADQQADRLWAINQSIFTAYPHYLAASGAPASGSMPGISMHTELEMLVRLGLSPREALAAATSNYAEQFHWSELGLIAPGRRADILILDADPTVSIWNVRRINTLLVDGNVIDRASLLKK
ncbi:amidohydrolase family protein [Acidicapsa dinghuensis]|uniref:Amidohydrolase family protein n=1 Tax=Acidicapsa dinghuensis TaxID=2218256 RepID=A0ABW1EJJ8_9BACT|nr:amidohydrolase family protein [Acidicapsa dinghuensis]